MSHDMEELMEEIEKSLIRPKRGEVVTGKVIQVSDKGITVNIGYKADGIVPRDEISNDPTITPQDVAKADDEISVYIIKTDDGEGNVLLSTKRVEHTKGWEDLEKIHDTESLVESKVVESVKGGVIAIARGIRCFIPASQLSDRYVDDLKTFVGKSFNAKVIEIDRQKNKAVLSRKEVLQQENKEKKADVFAKLEKGMQIRGEVKRLTNFGAFVDIGGIDGLVHISELSWGRVKNPSEVVSVEDQVEVKVIDFDETTGKVSLSIKQTQPEPWTLIADKFKAGDILEGKVVRLVDFGAFVELMPGLDGLVHISQISEAHIAKPSEELHVGQNVNVKVLDINIDGKRISLSMTAAQEDSTENEPTEYTDEDNNVTIGDIIDMNDKK
ncbi:RNA binding S1 domain protein [Alkaliphilus metalliredigens QYMF]|uniref:RNA binding S1 domain protein n=1 Tax=Alkaliphilus metalliredigens (strain QYMF) TaxID=293826 RepID=A6TRF8_ALKMQ|nr:30S ribosomal protein S1 [Alkaliphilus metalliredigens]ABR48776.1 RNA binding S1 domain protein [Alkaliphilus metalliredigens QYMF]